MPIDNLSDHFSVRISHRVGGIVTLNERTRGLPLLRELYRYIFYGKGLLTLGASVAGAYAKTDPQLKYPDFQLSFAPASYRPGTHTLEREAGMTAMVHQSYPMSRGSVFAQSADTRELPNVNPNYMSHDEDLRVIVSAVRHARAILSQPAMSRYSKAELMPGAHVQSDEDVLAYARQVGVSGSHFMGSCAMGSSPAAVVDHKLRVNGVTSLRVVDASIFPSVSCGNTQAPTIMAGAKGAALILNDANFETAGCCRI